MGTSKEIEQHLDDYDQEVIIRRKIAESKHFYLYKEAKASKLGKGMIYFHEIAYNETFLLKRSVLVKSAIVIIIGVLFFLLLMNKKQVEKCWSYCQCTGSA